MMLKTNTKTHYIFTLRKKRTTKEIMNREREEQVDEIQKNKKQLLNANPMRIAIRMYI